MANIWLLLRQTNRETIQKQNFTKSSLDIRHGARTFFKERGKLIQIYDSVDVQPSKCGSACLVRILSLLFPFFWKEVESPRCVTRSQKRKRTDELQGMGSISFQSNRRQRQFVHCPFDGQMTRTVYLPIFTWWHGNEMDNGFINEMNSLGSIIDGP